MEEIENRISGARALEKIFRQYNEKTFLLFQLPGKKGFVSNQVLKFLRWFWRKKIRKLRSLRTATGLSAQARNEDKDAKSYHQQKCVSSDLH
jgi:hypothetical protein